MRHEHGLQGWVAPMAGGGEGGFLEPLGGRDGEPLSRIVSARARNIRFQVERVLLLFVAVDGRQGPVAGADISAPKARAAWASQARTSVRNEAH
jgi:hypothetical protein